MTSKLDQICQFLEQLAPSELAESWDNVGLLVGDRTAEIERIMTCLTVTPASAAEAIERGANLIIAHHPLPFHALKRITTETTAGRLLWELIGRHIAIYSPHTSFDSAATGINQSLAEGLELRTITPLIAAEEGNGTLGTGRWGRTDGKVLVRELAQRLANFLHISHMHVVGRLDQTVHKVAVACGAAGELLAAARAAECDALVLGETNLHTCLEAEAVGIALLLPGHYASERFAVERLADSVQSAFAGLNVWASERESDPVQWLSWPV